MIENNLNFYIPKGFDEKQFVDIEVYDYFKERGWPCWTLFNPLLLRTAEALEKHYSAKIEINNWHEGGTIQFRGFRSETCTIGERFSAHRRGNAFDCMIPDQSSFKIQNDILNNPWDEPFKYITFIEVEVQWLHIDVTNHDKVKYGVKKISPYDTNRSMYAY